LGGELVNYVLKFGDPGDEILGVVGFGVLEEGRGGSISDVVGDLFAD